MRFEHTRFVLTVFLVGQILCSEMWVPKPLFAYSGKNIEPENITTKHETKEDAVTILIEPATLEKQRNQPRVRILDTRSKDDYTKKHIPSAVWVDVKSWQSLGKTKGGFHNTKAWSKFVGALGIELQSPVIVYGDSLSDTARIWWLLKYVGVKDVRILNGGWAHWVKENRATDNKTSQVKPTDFMPSFQADRLVEIDALKKSVKDGKVTIVDTRSKGEFTGQIVRGGRGGHLPGAKHLEWKELLANDGRFKSPDQLRALFRERGILPTATAVCY